MFNEDGNVSEFSPQRENLIIIDFGCAFVKF